VSGILYVVGTPIGNMGDLSRRALETLAAVDVVAAEDTRRTGRLLKAFGARAKLVSMFDGNERERTERLLERLRTGDTVAVVSDGGMPTVSDPGFRLVRACAEEGIDVRVVPGPSAVIAALAVSGLPTDRFTFEGFLPRRAAERTRRLEELSDDPRTIVVFESPLRVQILLRDVLVLLGDRRVALCRELTKRHEEVLRGLASEVLARVEEQGVRGEVTIVVEGDHDGVPHDPEALLDEVRRLVEGGMRTRDAARAVAERHGASANDLYRAAIAED